MKVTITFLASPILLITSLIYLQQSHSELVGIIWQYPQLHLFGVWFFFLYSYFYIGIQLFTKTKLKPFLDPHLHQNKCLTRIWSNRSSIIRVVNFSNCNSETLNHTQDHTQNHIHYKEAMIIIIIYTNRNFFFF